MLIRPQAIAEAQFRRYGRARTRVRPPLAVAAVAVASLLGALVWLACTTLYTERVQVPGYLVPDAGIVRLRAPRSGVVTDVRVRQGQWVAAGEPLVRIESERRIDDATTQSAARARNLQQRTEEIATQHALSETRMARELARLDRETTRLQAELALAQGQARDQDRWIALAHERLADVRAAAERGAVARADVLRLENDLIAGTLQRKSLERTVVALQAELDTSALRAREVTAERDASASRLAIASLDIESTALDNASSSSDVIAAPIAGTVVSLPVGEHSAVESGRELLVIAPDGGGVRADLFVPASAIGLVRNGAQVSMRYDAFPYQEFGVFDGRVREIARFVFDRRDVDVELPLRGAVFRVMATPDIQSVAVRGEAVALQPGMTLSADIALRELRVIEWLFEPLLGWRGLPFSS